MIKQYSIYLDAEMVKKIKFKCYNKEITMSGYIRRLIEKDLEKDK